MNTRKTALLSFTAFIFVLLALVGLMFFVFNQATAPVAEAPAEQAVQEQPAEAAPEATAATSPEAAPEAKEAPAEPGLPKVTYENEE